MKMFIAIALLISTPVLAGDGYTVYDRMRDQSFQRDQEFQQMQQYQQRHPAPPPPDDGYRDCYGCRN